MQPDTERKVNNREALSGLAHSFRVQNGGIGPNGAIILCQSANSCNISTAEQRARLRSSRVQGL